MSKDRMGGGGVGVVGGIGGAEMGGMGGVPGTGEFAGPLNDVAVAVAEACGGLMQKLEEFSKGRKEGGWLGEGVYVCVMLCDFVLRDVM